MANKEKIEDVLKRKLDEKMNYFLSANEIMEACKIIEGKEVINRFFEIKDHIYYPSTISIINPSNDTISNIIQENNKLKLQLKNKTEDYKKIFGRFYIKKIPTIFIGE